MKLKFTYRLITAVSIIVLASVLLASCGGCEHSYKDGVCTVCGVADPDYEPPCSHIFKDGACTVCGAEDPEYLHKDADRRFYTELVDKYKSLVLYKLTNAELPPRGGSGPAYTDALYEVVGQFQPYSKFGYSYKDFDGDGYVELLLTENTNRLYP